MRLLVRLQSVENTPYEMQYHYHLQGFIYNLLKGSKFGDIHDKGGYKFFCFSNIFPVKELHVNDIRTLIVSSPQTDFIQYLYETLQLLLGRGRELKIGFMRFKIYSLHKLEVRVHDNLPFTLITGTPIIIRIPKEKCILYGIRPAQDYDYVYWRLKYPIDLFLSQIENNLFRKYQEYNIHRNFKDTKNKKSDSTIPSIPIFQKFRFKKQISTKIVMKDTEQIVIGTIWEFEFDTYEHKELIEFVIDAGLGERNSFGFGFMNMVH